MSPYLGYKFIYKNIFLLLSMNDSSRCNKCSICLIQEYVSQNSIEKIIKHDVISFAFLDQKLITSKYAVIYK